MTNLEKMWEALKAYQPHADAAGHGESWAKMCAEKTHVAAASVAAADEAGAYKWVQKAIKHINKAHQFRAALAT